LNQDNLKELRVGLLGIGTVGGGTYTVLTRNAAEITRRTGVAIRVVQVADRNIEHAKTVTGGIVDVTNDAFAWQ
jgi:homoserine dehydrogenase